MSQHLLLPYYGTDPTLISSYELAHLILIQPKKIIFIIFLLQIKKLR